MATRSILCGLSLWVALVVGCQAIEKRRKGDDGTASPTSTGESVHATRPDSPRSPPAKLGVILGPGGAKALSSAQVLKAFQEMRIPVDYVVGLEWGAYVGALYAQNGQAHEVEWQTYKMLQLGLPHKKSLFGQSADSPSVNVMDGYLTSVFGKTATDQMRIPFACPMRRTWSGLVIWQSNGKLSDAVRHCLPYPPVFKTQGSSVAGTTAIREAARYLRSKGVGVIVYVDTLGTSLPRPQRDSMEHMDEVVLWQEVKYALGEASTLDMEVVRVDTSSVPVIGFGSVKELSSRAYVAGKKAAQRIIEKYGF